MRDFCGARLVCSYSTGSNGRQIMSGSSLQVIFFQLNRSIPTNYYYWSLCLITALTVYWQEVVTGLLIAEVERRLNCKKTAILRIWRGQRSVCWADSLYSNRTPWIVILASGLQTAMLKLCRSSGRLVRGGGLPARPNPGPPWSRPAGLVREDRQRTNRPLDKLSIAALQRGFSLSLSIESSACVREGFNGYQRCINQLHCLFVHAVSCSIASSGMIALDSTAQPLAAAASMLTSG